MSDEIVKPEIDIDKIVSEKLAVMLSSKDDEIKKLNELYEATRKEVELIKTLNIKKDEVKPVIVEQPVVKPVEVNPMEELLKQREAEKIKIEEQKKILENESAKAENEILKLQIAVTNELTNKPYLEEIIKEAIKEGRVKNVNDLKILVSPTMEAKLKVAFQLEQDMKKAGIDPLATYGNNESVMTNVVEMQNKKEYEGMVAEWGNFLSRK